MARCANTPSPAGCILGAVPGSTSRPKEMGSLKARGPTSLGIHSWSSRAPLSPHSLSNRPGFFHGFWELNSGFHTCTANSFPRSWGMHRLAALWPIRIRTQVSWKGERVGEREGKGREGVRVRRREYLEVVNLASALPGYSLLPLPHEGGVSYRTTPMSHSWPAGGAKSSATGGGPGHCSEATVSFLQGSGS